MEKYTKNYTNFLNEAYVSKEKMKQVQTELKAAFPEFKFSIRKENYSCIDVDILSGPIKLTDKENGYQQVHHIGRDDFEDKPEVREFLTKVLEIINKGNYDKSDIMTDYFDVGFYVRLSIGRWDKPYEISDKRVGKKPKSIKEEPIELPKEEPKQIEEEPIELSKEEQPIPEEEPIQGKFFYPKNALTKNIEKPKSRWTSNSTYVKGYNEFR